MTEILTPPEKCRYCGGELMDEWDEWICKGCDKSNGMVVKTYSHEAVDPKS
jgi:hypothetical protein